MPEGKAYFAFHFVLQVLQDSRPPSKIKLHTIDFCHFDKIKNLHTIDFCHFHKIIIALHIIDFCHFDKIILTLHTIDRQNYYNVTHYGFLPFRQN